MWKEKDLFFMQKALMQANVAFKKNEVPVGVVIVDDAGKIVSRAYNKIEGIGCQAGHAEVLAIKKACKKIGGWRLDGCSIYVTLEPCLMCLGLIQLSRIKNLYFGAVSEEFGSGLSDVKKHKFYKKDLKIAGGLKEKECADILKLFFKNIRKKKRVYYETKTRVFGKSKT
ncbi:MAG: nucleoside deaminase [bacterium]